MENSGVKDMTDGEKLLLTSVCKELGKYVNSSPDEKLDDEKYNMLLDLYCKLTSKPRGKKIGTTVIIPMSEQDKVQMTSEDKLDYLMKVSEHIVGLCRMLEETIYDVR